MNMGKRLAECLKAPGWDQTRLAAESGVGQQTISIIIKRDSKRSEHAPALANALGVDINWLLTGKGEKFQRLSVQEPRATYFPKPRAIKNVRADEVQIPRLSTRASMGNGCLIADHVDVVETFAASVAALRQRVSFSSPANLRLVPGYGQSMQPSFNDGDLLLVDVGVTELKVDSVYCLERDSELFIKRITRDPTKNGFYRMSSDNATHPSWDINPERDGFKILGIVLLAWNVNKL